MQDLNILTIFISSGTQRVGCNLLGIDQPLSTELSLHKELNKINTLKKTYFAATK